MRKSLWLAIAGALVVSVVAASAQSEVLSANAVGYIKINLPAGGKLVAASIPLDSMTETQIVFGRTSLANEMPQGSQVFFWDEVHQGWSGGGKSAKGWSAGQSNRVVKPGECFFIQGNPAAVADVEVTITGEVPADATIQRTLLGGNALATVGNPYPVDFKFGDSQLAIDAPQASQVSFWDMDHQGWSGGQKSGKGWSGGESNKVVQAGEGFFLRQVGAAGSWVAVKPYTWP